MGGSIHADPVTERAAGRPPGTLIERWTRRSRKSDLLAQRCLPEVQLAASLTNGECPICARTAGDADHLMRYFAIEGHGELEVLEGYRRGPFCATHGHYAVTRTDMASPLGAVQSFALRAGLRCDFPPPGRDRRFGAGADPRCLACRSLRETTLRFVFFLANLLHGTWKAGQYPYAGLICQTHLTLLTPHLSDGMLRPLLETCAVRLETASPPDSASNGIASLEPILRLTVGNALPLPAWPKPAGVTSRKPGDPGKDLLRDIAEVSSCPVCLEMARVMTHWTKWLGEAVNKQEIADLLPTCREHVWALVLAGPPPLAHRAVEVNRRQHLGHLGLALGKMPAARNDSLQRYPLALWRRFRDGDPSALSRAWLRRPSRCPFCDRLDVAEAETLALLGILLRLQPNRGLFANGFGLCLRHAARFEQVCPDNDVKHFVRSTESAKLALLSWELTVSARKNAWQWRPDPKGSEMAAPLAGVLRLSGGTFDPAQRFD